MRKAEKFIIGNISFELYVNNGNYLVYSSSAYWILLDDWIYLTAYDQGGIQGLINYSLVDSRPGLLHGLWIGI
jgi:hypothetical protein